MDRFAKLWASQENISNSPDQRAAPDPEPSVLGEEEQIHSTVVVNARSTAAAISVQRVAQEVVDLCNLPADPAQRRPMSQFKTAKVRDDVRRAYLQKGPFQPKNHSFPQTDMSGIPRRFNSAWFSKYGGWLEYSIDEDAVYCLCCYLFQNESLGHGGGDAFSRKGWRLWNKATRLDVHVGGPSSAHNQNMKRCDDLVNQNQSISAAIIKQTKKSKREYRTRLIASIDIARLLLCSGLPFRGHDESESSLRKGNFLTFYEWYAERCPEVGAVCLGNAPKNLKLICPEIQKDIVKACAEETLKAIIEDVGDEYFAILVDESRDVSHKEQMALVIRYVDRRGFVMERLIGLAHVSQTTSLALKQAIYKLVFQIWMPKLLSFASNMILVFQIWMPCMFLEDQSQSEEFRLMAFQMRITTKVSCAPSLICCMWSLMTISVKAAPPCSFSDKYGRHHAYLSRLS